MLATGADSANTLATYYDVLTRITLDSWRDQVAFSALLGVPAPMSLNQDYETRLQVLGRRAGLAHGLASLFIEMAKSKDAAGLRDAASAGDALDTSLQGMPNLPGVSDLDPNLFGKAGHFFVDFQRGKDLRRGLKSLEDVLAGMKTLFEKERGAYARFSKERNETAEHLLILLWEKRIVAPAGLLRTLPLAAPIENLKDEQGNAAGLAIAKVDIFRAGFAWDCATRESGLVLQGLIEKQKQAAAGSSPDLRTLREHIGAAGCCLAEYKQIARGGG